MNNQIQKAAQAQSMQTGGKQKLQDLIKIMQPEIKKALPSVL